MNTIKSFLLGVCEFRSNYTTHIADWHLANAYNHGREWAHRLTFRHFEQ